MIIGWRTYKYGPRATKNCVGCQGAKVPVPILIKAIFVIAIKAEPRPANNGNRIHLLEAKINRSVSVIGVKLWMISGIAISTIPGRARKEMTTCFLVTICIF